MLFRDLQIYNRIWSVFSYQWFSLYNYKASEASAFRSEARGDVERLAVPLKGETRVDSTTLGERDTAYIPVGQQGSVEAAKGSIIYIAKSRASNRHPFYMKRFSESYWYNVGAGLYKRRVYATIEESDPGDSFIAGYVEGEEGAWNSYPPHGHDEKPKAYMFFGMGKGFCVQILIDEEGEATYIVRDCDVVLIPRGYHPNVCTSLAGCKHLWIIAAPIGKRDLSASINPASRDIDTGKSHLEIKSK